MLSGLSGESHVVYTGVTFFTRASGSVPAASFYESTVVRFAAIPDAVIWAYIRTGEPMDKAGAYGIQGIGGAFVERIEGCYFNVMGFPMHRFSKEVLSLLEDEQL